MQRPQGNTPLVYRTDLPWGWAVWLLMLAWLCVLGRGQAVGEEIRLSEEGGVFKVPVRINEVLTLKFVFDTGAAEVQIPAEVFLTLLRTDTVQLNDFLEGRTYQLPNGTTVKSHRFRLRSLRMGSRLVTDVTARISEPSSPLLLGQNVLKKLGSWSMNSAKGLLILGPPGPTQRDAPTPRAGASPSAPVAPPLTGIPTRQQAALPTPPPPSSPAGPAQVRQLLKYALSAGGADNEEAIAALKRQIEAAAPTRRLEPKVVREARAENDRGLLLLHEKQLPEAVAAFRSAARLDPLQVEINNNLGYGLFLMGELPEAEQRLIQTLTLAPGRADAWGNLGQTYAKQEKLQEAVACLAHTFRFSRDPEKTRQWLAGLAASDETPVREAAKQTLALPLLQAAR